jgi:hypothetical protein
LQYDITIDPTNNYWFNEVAFDVDQFAPTSANKKVTNLVDLTMTTLQSTDGANDPITPILGAPTKTIRVLDTYLATTGTVGFFNSSSNKFTQVLHANNVPEPSSVLGLLAVSGLGLGMLRKKQG